MTQKTFIVLSFVLAATVLSCKQAEDTPMGTIERLDPALDAILSPDASIEVIGQGYVWSEGPIWVADKNMLLFSDVPTNNVYSWKEGEGVKPYLTPSGYTGQEPRGGEMGSNGLTLDDEGNLILCQHGDRRIAMMDSPLDSAKPVFQTIADNFNGKKFNSPNDVVFRNYEFYFTDPPYGLEKKADDPKKEIPFQGVYRVSASGKVSVLVDTITRPNGLAFSPDGRYLIVANSDSLNSRWYRYDFADSVITGGKIFYDARSLVPAERGFPDGLKIDSQGTVFATGPGGVFIFNLDGKLLGKIRTREKASNCALSADEKTLFVTNDDFVLRIVMRK